ncbi:uncharacterized protein DNG_09000 [Cephalotrichum gorgonifer]|uniref:Secreted protein n=1 Tax=Cephalotrichum gorgonifer TaxID=2041049 RepID=A0AAE8N4S7_9PEZI|nr:uncharacterized protein DNG_09000 [Cephalotrichum gorgonifer]
MRIPMILAALSVVAFSDMATANPTPIDTDISFDDTDNGHNLTAELIAQGHEIFPMTFSGDFGPNGETLSFNGTIQEVMEQIRVVNPSYDFDAAAPGTGIQARGRGDWRKRDVRKKECNTGDWASGVFIANDIRYLRNVPKDTCKLEAKGCARVSCARNAAIFVCWEPFGDSPKTYEKSWDYVSDYAEGLAAGEWCPRYFVPQDPLTVFLVKGKAWDPKGMAVRIGRDQC